MGNLPVVKDLVVDMEPFWAKFKAMKPWLQPGYAEPPDGKEYLVTQPEMNAIHKESLCINCGCCVSECNAMESDPEFLGPQALAKGMRFVGDPRDHATVERLEEYSGEHGIWECTRCYFCNERCPKGVDPRDAIAKLGAEAMQARDRPRHGREAREVVRHLGEDDGLAARDRARAEDAGHRRVDQGDEVRDGPRAARQGAARRSRRTSRRTSSESRALYDLVKQQGRDGATGIVQGEKALGALDHGVHGAERDPYGPGSFPRPYLPDEEAAAVKKVAYYKGCLASLSAKELDSSTQALAPKVGLELEELESVTCCGAGDIHEAEPDYYLHLNARILAYAEATGADTLMTICNVCTLNLRQANWQLKNDEELRERVNENLQSVGVPAYNGDVDVRHLLWLISEGPGYELLQQAAHKGLKGLKIAPFYGCQILRPSKLLGFEDPDSPSSLERIIEACGGERDRLSGEDQVLRLPDHPGPRGDGARRADPADRAGEGGRRRRDRDAVPALPPLARRVAVEAEEADRQGLPDADPAPLAAGRRRRRDRRSRS